MRLRRIELRETNLDWINGSTIDDDEETENYQDISEDEEVTEKLLGYK